MAKRMFFCQVISKTWSKPWDVRGRNGAVTTFNDALLKYSDAYSVPDLSRMHQKGYLEARV
jgi:hypothetical protein